MFARSSQCGRGRKAELADAGGRDGLLIEGEDEEKAEADYQELVHAE